MQLSATRFVKHPAGSIDAAQLRGWTPIEARSFGDLAVLNWTNFGDMPFAEPFFFQTVARLQARDSYEILTTGFEALETFQEVEDGLEPNGFVFHISHCGSTLVSNVLNGIPRNLSVSEPAPVNDVFIAENASEEQRVTWLRGMIRAYGQRRLGCEDNFFLKFNSWAIGFFPLIRAAFPQTPWICLYRHPVEVMAGQFRRGVLNTYWLQDQRYSGLSREERVQVGLVEVLARTMGRYYAAIRQMATADPGGLCIDYNQLSNDTYARILEHFNVELAAGELEAMCEQSKIYAKDLRKEQIFSSDSETKRKEAYAAVHEMAETWAMPAYAALEEVRLR